MKKNIDIPDDIRWELEALALQEKKGFENIYPRCSYFSCEWAK